MVKPHNDYYTYVYLRADRTPYYIGKGRGKRIYSKARGIKAPKNESLILFLKKNLTEAEAFKHEIYMIFVLGRKDLGTGILRNLTEGGDGPSGAVRNNETRKKLSAAKSGEKNPQFGRIGENSPNYGIRRTEAQKKANSERMSGEKNPNYGKTGALSPLSKAIIAIKHDGTELSFGSVCEAARELGIDKSSLFKYLKTGQILKKGNFKGWRFSFENP